MGHIASGSEPTRVSGAKDLVRLADLHERGALTDEEFAAQKAVIIRTPATERRETVSGWWSDLGNDALLALAGLLVIFLVGILLQGAPPAQSRSQEILAGCQREFASEGEPKVSDCALQIEIRELAEREDDKLRRAGR